MNGLAFAPPLLETVCLFRPYDNVGFTSARCVLLTTEQHLAERRGLNGRRILEVTSFLEELRVKYSVADWREFSQDGYWLQAILGEHVPLFCRTLDEAVERGYAVLPRGNLAESRADPYLSPLTQWGHSVVNGNYILLENLVQPSPAPRTN